MIVHSHEPRGREGDPQPGRADRLALRAVAIRAGGVDDAVGHAQPDRIGSNLVIVDWIEPTMLRSTVIQAPLSMSSMLGSAGRLGSQSGPSHQPGTSVE